MSDYASRGRVVSRETSPGLERFDALVRKWSPRINLVSRSDLEHVWERHIADSAQLNDLDIQGKSWVDLGSGGGFPAIVLAILSKQDETDRSYTLIESDRRKAVFLRTAIRELALNAQVLSERIEVAPPLGADVVSARALAPLKQLLAFADRHLKKGGMAVFLKGETWEKEVADARESWSFDLKATKSKTNPQAAILKIRDIERV
jgi:16S rRNA (guanine527-N7)-methyltransferase